MQDQQKSPQTLCIKISHAHTHCVPGQQKQRWPSALDRITTLQPPRFRSFQACTISQLWAVPATKSRPSGKGMEHLYLKGVDIGRKRRVCNQLRLKLRTLLFALQATWAWRVINLQCCIGNVHLSCYRHIIYTRCVCSHISL